MNEKRPYWEHPLYNPENDPREIENVVLEMLKPLTSNLPCSVVKYCTCDKGVLEHDVEPLLYKFGENDSTYQWAKCPKREFANGKLIMKVKSRIWPEISEFVLRQLEENLFIVEISGVDEENQLEDSGDQAAWEGGNVDAYPEEDSKTAEEFAKSLERLEAEIREMNELYEPFPDERSSDTSVYLRGNSGEVAKEIYRFMKIKYPEILKLLASNKETVGVPDKLTFGDNYEFALSYGANSDFAYFFVKSF